MNASSSPPDVARLFHHRWNVPLLACLEESRVGTRLVVLEHQLGASRDSLRSSLSALIDLGLVARNPGYGHPLRPEYVLTGSGKCVAPPCVRYRELLEDMELCDVGFRKWTAPSLLAIHRGLHRFGVIQSALEGISPRALTSALRLLDGFGLVFRRIEDGYPPRAEYFLSKKGDHVACAVGGIAEGLENASVPLARQSG